jgi:hypothetical protein
MIRRLFPALTLLSMTAALAQAGLTSISIVNPGFQADNYATFPGYNGDPGNPAQPTGWTQTGGGGVNGSDIGAGAPFSDGATLDGTRVGFIQGAGTVSQTLSGLTPGKQYYFQGYFRGRNCCGDTPTFGASLGAASLITNANIGTGTWQAFSVPFTATAASGLLSISSAPALGGDASLAYDGITVFQLDSDYIPLLNPSFEAGGTSFAFPGYMSVGPGASNMAGWTKTGAGNVGYNYAGNNPFADNGAIPEGAAAGFIQNSAALSQVITGLVPGQQYLLELDYNARAGTGSGQISVDFGGTNLLATGVVPVGGSIPWHHLAAVWTATGTSATLSIEGIQVGGDSAITFDNITLRAVPEPSAAAAALTGLALLGLRRRR